MGVSDPSAPPIVHRAGVVALLGRPNAGKSTLLNRVLGQKLAIVTAKPQTTRSRILGVLTLPHAQLLLLDTPGLHEASRALNRALNAIATDVADDCDVALLLIDLDDLLLVLGNFGCQTGDADCLGDTDGDQDTDLDDLLLILGFFGQTCA